MMAMTHGVIGAVSYVGLASFSGAPVVPVAVGAAMVGAWLPDVDTPSSKAGMCVYPLAVWMEGKFGHRTITHSVVGTLIFAALCAPLLLFFHLRVLYFALLCGYVSHLLADAATKSGVPLAWPRRERWVFPGNENYRIKTGSGAELVLLTVFLVIGYGTFVMAKQGARRMLHLAIGDLKGATRDVEDLNDKYHSEAEVSGYDMLHQKVINGRFRIVGRRGDGGLLVERGGVLWLVDDTGTEPYRIKPRKVRIHQLAPRHEETRVVRVGNLTLGALAQRLPRGARVTGVAKCYPSIASRVHSPSVGIHTVQFLTRDTVKFDFATPAHLLASSPTIALQPATLTITAPKPASGQKSVGGGQQRVLNAKLDAKTDHWPPTSDHFPRLLWPTRRSVILALGMRRHADLKTEAGATVRRGQVLNHTFAQHIEHEAPELPLDPLVSIATSARRAAIVELRALELEVRALRASSLWPHLASRFAARRASLERQKDEPIPAPPSREPIIETRPKPNTSRAPFSGIVERVEWEAPTLATEKGEKAEHAAQITIVEVQTSHS